MRSTQLPLLGAKGLHSAHRLITFLQPDEDYNIAQRHQGTQQPGGRYALAAFVTGELDPAQTREAFLADVKQISVPVMVIIAEQAPPSTKAKMAAIAAMPNVQTARLTGTLGMAEEYGEDVADAILPLLQAGNS